MDGKDRNGLKLKKIQPIFSHYDVMFSKNHQKNYYRQLSLIKFILHGTVFPESKSRVSIGFTNILACLLSFLKPSLQSQTKGIESSHITKVPGFSGFLHQIKRAMSAVLNNTLKRPIKSHLHQWKPINTESSVFLHYKKFSKRHFHPCDRNLELEFSHPSGRP